MTPEDFELVVEEVQKGTTRLLLSKSSEYSRGEERFHNFIQAGRRLGCDPIVALFGMKEKHSVSIADMVDDLRNGELPSEDMLSEKFFDEINYLILAYAMFIERIETGEKDGRFDKSVKYTIQL